MSINVIISSKAVFCVCFSHLPAMKSSARRPLQPKNIFQTPTTQPTQLLLKPKLDLLSKENLPVVQSIDASLAQELSAFKKKLERLREDQERTEKLLEERDRGMGLQMAHLLERGEFQKSLEIQVDRLFRLKELHAYSSKISPIRSLRAKEDEKRRRFSLEPSVSGDTEEPGEEEEECRDGKGSSELEKLSGFKSVNVISVTTWNETFGPFKLNLYLLDVL